VPIGVGKLGKKSFWLPEYKVSTEKSVDAGSNSLCFGNSKRSLCDTALADNKDKWDDSTLTAKRPT
jgi:hypothetical protein